MIPVKLTLHNFMPYLATRPPLDFAGMRTVTICGDNGNGKSALIDAMTWALWGKTRARSDDDLIHMGQTETEVEFEFAVGEQLYRIIRKHARAKNRRASGQSSLDLFIAGDGVFKTISGDSILQTQQKIVGILHMDYETFTNSAYLRQGHADEFTIARPAERKQVLANILGLSLYDELEEQARETARHLEVEKEQLELAVKDLAEQLTLKPAYDAELARAADELSRTEKATVNQEARLNELRAEKELLSNRQTELTQLETHIQETNRALVQWNEAAAGHNSHIREYEDLIYRRVQIEEGYARFAKANNLNDELNQKLRLSAALSDRKHKLEMVILQASQELLKRHALLGSRIADLQAKSAKLPQFRSEMQSAQAEMVKLAPVEETLRQQQKQAQELRGSVQTLESEQARLEKEFKDIDDKLALLLTEKGAKCPLCETELGADGIKLIESKYHSEKQQNVDQTNLVQVEIGQQKLSLSRLDSEISRLESGLNQEKASAQSRVSLLNQQIAEVEQCANQAESEKTSMAEVEERLARKDFAVVEQETLSRIEVEMARLDYDPQKHEQARAELSNLEQYESPKRKLEEAERLISQEKEAASRAEQAAQEQLANIESDSRRKQDLAVDLARLPQLASELAFAESEYQTLNTQQKRAQETVGTIKGKLLHCAELEARKTEKERQLAAVNKEAIIYRELAQAFGKKGIQAWLIELALPEIEIEANRLLARMTDNRMHVKMETQRESRKGEPMETLDINISDELGTRSYEMFSGGEAFRINFAIRIALSKMLARRAGAPLPTLIIDEGFGTQDNTGIEKLKEAITSIQDDFEKIIVITHIEELKDAFPARIDVIKTAEGSVLSMS